MGDCAEGEPDESWSLLCGEQASRERESARVQVGWPGERRQLQQPRRQWKWGEVKIREPFFHAPFSPSPCSGLDRGPAAFLPQTQQGTPHLHPT